MRNTTPEQTEFINRIKSGVNITDIKKGLLKDRIKAFDDSVIPKVVADSLLKNLKLSISPRLKPTTSPFNFNLPDTLRDYLEFRCTTTFSNMTKYLIEMIQNDMDNLTINGTEMPLAELCEKDPELAAKAIRYTVSQFDRLGCTEATMVDALYSPLPPLGEKVSPRAFDALNPYEKWSSNIKAMAQNNEAGAVFDSIICHADLEKFVKKTIKDTPWENARIILMDVDILRYNIFFMKNYRTEIVALKKSDTLLKAYADDHGEYYYNADKLKKWFDMHESTSRTIPEKKYRAVESISADGTSTFAIEECKPYSNVWVYTGIKEDSLEKARKAVEGMKKYQVIKEEIHEL